MAEYERISEKEFNMISLILNTSAVSSPPKGFMEIHEKCYALLDEGNNEIAFKVYQLKKTPSLAGTGIDEWKVVRKRYFKPREKE